MRTHVIKFINVQNTSCHVQQTVNLCLVYTDVGNTPDLCNLSDQISLFIEKLLRIVTNIYFGIYGRYKIKIYLHSFYWKLTEYFGNIKLAKRFHFSSVGHFFVLHAKVHFHACCKGIQTKQRILFGTIYLHETKYKRSLITDGKN